MENEKSKYVFMLQDIMDECTPYYMIRKYGDQEPHILFKKGKTYPTLCFPGETYIYNKENEEAYLIPKSDLNKPINLLSPYIIIDATDETNAKLMITVNLKNEIEKGLDIYNYLSEELHLTSLILDIKL